MIKVSNLELNLGGQKILSDVSLEIAKDSVLVIMGPSGCGKTSLLRVIAGLLKPSQGEISIDSVRLDDYLTKKNISIVFQKYANISWLNALDNVAAGFPRSMGKTERKVAAMDRLREVGLENASGKYMGQLSGGMQQRVALARSLCQQSDLLLLDEPFAALDTLTRNEVNNVLKRLLKIHPRTVVLITHNIEDALTLADDIVVVGGTPGKILGRIHTRSHSEAEVKDSVNRLLKTSFQITPEVADEHGLVIE